MLVTEELAFRLQGVRLGEARRLRFPTGKARAEADSNKTAARLAAWAYSGEVWLSLADILESD